jgi:4-diphosphocytidyl-2-C-methyl-D-erythritol kinase
MAEKLGSDVPFFLTGGLAWVSGRGEYMEPLSAKSLNDLAVILVNPGFPSATAEAFRRLDQWRAAAGGQADRRPPPLSKEAFIRALGGPPRDWPYTNDFLPVFLAGEAGETVPAPGGTVSPESKAYRDIIARMGALGADFSGLSGAGSTCFGVFTGGGRAEKAAQILSKEWKFVELTYFLACSAVPVLE